MPKISAPDLTKRPPRSPRVRLGGYVLLPRMIDKGRATIVKKNGEFHYDCPLDQHFLKFAGIDAKKLKAELAKGKGDGEILKWVKEHSKTKPSFLEIIAWSEYQQNRVPSDTQSRKYLDRYHEKVAPDRKDLSTWFDVLDVDDFVTFGGKP